MHAPFDNIVQHLFHQPSLHSVTVDELESMAKQHPYFAAAHFLLLKKMQDSDHPQFNTQLYKTTLYFNNPLWLQFLLQPETVSNFTVSEKSPFINSEPATAPAFAEEPPINSEEQPADDTDGGAMALDHEQPVAITDLVQHETNAVVEAPVHSSADEVGPPTQLGIMDVISEVFNEPGAETNPPVSENEDNLIHQEIDTAGTITAIETEEARPEENMHPVAEPANEQPDNAETLQIAAAADEETYPVASVTENDNHFGIGPDDTAETAQLPEAIAAPETSTEEHVPSDTDNGVITNTPGATITEEPAMVATEPTAAIVYEVFPEAHENIHTEQAVVTDEKPLFKTIIETPAAKTDFLFEPYHTVDYFASQGIKLSKAEAGAKDSFGRQLKSFTEWLKTMKKLPKASIEKMLSENEESKVVADAIHSIENKEVITEAMAEVFEKQGMVEKAAEVYQKLSLLNPGKSAYFAAKIEDLKH